MQTVAARSVEERFELLTSEEMWAVMDAVYDNSHRTADGAPFAFQRNRKIYPADPLAKALATLDATEITMMSALRAENTRTFNAYINVKKNTKDEHQALGGVRHADLLMLAEVSEILKMPGRLSEARKAFGKAEEVLKKTTVPEDVRHKIMSDMWKCYEARDQDVMDVVEFMVLMQIRMTIADHPAMYHNEQFATAVRKTLRKNIMNNKFDVSIVEQLRRNGELGLVMNSIKTPSTAAAEFQDSFQEKVREKKKEKGQGRPYFTKPKYSTGHGGYSTGRGGYRTGTYDRFEAYMRTNKPDVVCKFNDCRRRHSTGNDKCIRIHHDEREGGHGGKK